MSQVYCTKCGQSNEAESHFCVRCGTPLEASQPAALPDRPPDRPKAAPMRPEFVVLGGVMAFFLLAVCAVGVVFWATQAQSPTGAGPRPTAARATATPFQATSPAGSNPAQAAVDLPRLARIAQDFSNPNGRKAADSKATAADILTSPAAFAGETVTVTGKLAQRVILYNLAPQDWPRSYYFAVQTGGITIPVVYRGYVGGVEPGDLVEVVGAYSVAGQGINADRVSSLESRPSVPLPTTFSLPLALATAGNVVWAVLCTGVFVWRARHHAGRRPGRRGPGRSALPIGLGLLSLLLSACTINIATTVYPDGSGTVGVTLAETPDNVTFLRQMPGMADYFQTWRSSLRAQGVLVDDSVYSNTERIHLQSVFGSVNDIAQAAPGAEERSWVYANVSTEAADRVYRYTALVDTTALFEQAPGVDPNVASQAQQQLQQTKIEYAVTLPGTIVYENASRMNGNQLIWDIRMNDLNQIRAEARLAGPPADYSSLFWLAEGVAFALFALVFLLSLVVFRPRKA